ncbi:MAG: restriction endonuclease subunit S, partial [Thermoproteota archaeon]
MTRQAKLGDFRKKEIYEATEDKEVQGPYELPEGWRWVKLEDVCWINREVMDPRKKIPDKEFVYIDISGVEGGIGQILNVKKILGKDAPSRARRVIHTNDVIMSTVRPYLKSFAIIPEEYDNQICSTGFAVLSCRERIIPKYLFYALFSNTVIRQCNDMMIGAHYPALRFDQVAKIKIPLPPLEEQERIVSRLNELVNRAEEAKRLRKQAREEAEKLIQAALNKVFSRAEEEGWKWVKLSEICKVNPSKSEINGFPNDMQVTFVPMTAVSEVTGRIEKPEVRLLGEV